MACSEERYVAKIIYIILLIHQGEWTRASGPPAQEATTASAAGSTPAPLIYETCDRSDIHDRLTCDANEEITIVYGYCTFIGDCSDNFYYETCVQDRTSEYTNDCDGREDCNVRCGNGHGWSWRPSGCSWSNNHRWMIIAYNCSGGQPLKATKAAEPSTTVDLMTSSATSQASTTITSSSSTTTQGTTSTVQPTTTATLPQTTTTTIPSTTTHTAPSTNSSLATEPITTVSLITESPTTSPSTTTQATTVVITNGTQTTLMTTTPAQIPLEEVLSSCFDNATQGESSAKPYRPLGFSTPSDAQEERLSVSFYSPFLQSKPVKVAIEAFQEPKPDCDTSPASPSNSTSTAAPKSADKKTPNSALSLTSVVNVTVYCYNGAPLQLREGEYVDVVFPAKIDFDNEIPVCTSMKQDEFGWEWTAEGCKAPYSNYTHVTCRCDHLSAIALQRAPKGFKVEGIHVFVLMILEKVIGVASLISVLVMIVIYMTLGVRRSQLTTVQLNIAVCAAAGHAAYMFGIHATGNLFICSVMAAIMQYLYTVYVLWLVVQTSLLFYTCYVHGKPRESNLVQLQVPMHGITEPIRLTRTTLIVYGGSMLLVGLLYKEIPYGFGTPESCWLVETENVYIIFISSLIIALVINFINAICTVVYLVKMDDHCRGDNEGYADWAEKLRNRVRLCLSSSFILSIVLITAWSSHALLVFKSILAFDYLYIICNMSHGFLVFLFYCPLNPEVRAAIFRTNKLEEDDDKKVED